MTIESARARELLNKNQQLFVNVTCGSEKGKFKCIKGIFDYTNEV